MMFLSRPHFTCFRNGVLFLALAGGIGGCMPAAPVSEVPAAAERSGSVVQSGDYRTAKALFSEKRFAEADRVLQGLLADSRWRGADRIFLQRQRDICAQTMAGASPAGVASVAKPAPSAPSTAAAAAPVSADCGPRALLLLCREAGLPATLPALSKTAGVTAPRGASLEGMAKAAASVGFAPLAVQMDRDALANLSTPALAWVDGNHYMAVFQVNRSLRGIAYDTVNVQDPNKERKETIALTTLLSRSGGVLLTLPQAQAPKANGE